MSQENTNRIHRIYGIILTVFIVVLGVLLIYSCLDIYLSGDYKPYTSDAIALRFQRIRIWVYASLFAVAGGIFLDLVIPKKTVTGKQLQKRTTPSIPRERTHAHIVRSGLLVVAVVLITVGICNGGAEYVLKKAIAICSECIGLG